MKRKYLRICILLSTALVIVLLLSSTVPGGFERRILHHPIYLNTAYSFEERAADLISRLTLEEKESLLGNSMPAVPRLGINAFNVWRPTGSP